MNRQQPKSSNAGPLLLVFLSLFIGLMVLGSLSVLVESLMGKPVSTAQTNKHRVERLEDKFSAWDGSHYQIVRVIKNQMNDPDSFKHVETRYWKVGEGVIVSTTFRGKNAFGGMVIDEMTALCDAKGNFVAIVED